MNVEECVVDGRGERGERPAMFMILLTAMVAAVLGGTITIVGVVIATRYPANHVGFDVRWLYGLAGVGVLWCAFVWLTRAAPGWLIVAVVVLSAGLVGVVLAADGLNLFVEYETWLKRGMPGPFH